MYSENKDEQDYEEGANSYRNRSRRNDSNATGSGTANRISAYRKSNMNSNRFGSRDESAPAEEDLARPPIVAGHPSSRQPVSMTSAEKEVSMEIDLKETLNNLNEVE